jgi:hypothetical protein
MILRISEAEKNIRINRRPNVRIRNWHKILLMLVLLGTCSSWGEQSVTVAWDPNPEGDIEGYTVYYGNASGRYTNSVPVGNVTNATVHGLVADTTYYFTVTARNTAGLESDPSNEIAYSPPTAIVNHPPSAVLGGCETTEDTQTVIALAGSDPDGDALTFAIVSAPQHGQLTGTAPNLFYTPDANYSGADAFTYSVSDPAFLSATGTVTIAVLAVNDPPLPENDAFTRKPNASKTILLSVLLGNDMDPDGDGLKITSVSSTSALGVPLTVSTSSVKYAPPSGMNIADSFVYTVTDGMGAIATATVTITVKQSTKTSDTAVRTALVRDQGRQIVRLLGDAGEIYTVEASTDLSTWITLQEVQADSDGQFEFADPDAALFTHRFYRVLDSQQTIDE